MAGVGMTGKERRDSGNFLDSSEKVSRSIGGLHSRNPDTDYYIEKRTAAQKAETDFFALLKESVITTGLLSLGKGENCRRSSLRRRRVVFSP